MRTFFWRRLVAQQRLLLQMCDRRPVEAAVRSGPWSRCRLLTYTVCRDVLFRSVAKLLIVMQCDTAALGQRICVVFKTGADNSSSSRNPCSRRQKTSRGHTALWWIIDLLKGEVGPAQNSGAEPEPSPPELTCCFALTSAIITPSSLRRTNCNLTLHYLKHLGGSDGTTVILSRIMMTHSRECNQD